LRRRSFRQTGYEEAEVPCLTSKIAHAILPPRAHLPVLANSADATERLSAKASAVMVSLDERRRLRFDASIPVMPELSRIIVASILRDMRTRFGRSYIAYLIAIGWPLSHMSAILVAYIFSNRIAPIGDDPSIFIATGAAPYVLCLYPARFTAMSITQNRPLLNFPIFRPIHLIISRALLEILSAFVVFIVFVGILALAGMTVMPIDIHQACRTIALIIYFGISVGVFGVVMCSFSTIVGIIVIVLSFVGLYLTSGALVPASFFSETTRSIFWYNPMYHLVGLLRSAFFTNYVLEEYSFFYVLFVSNVLLFLGLLGERMLRGKILKGA
jgi:capsular polysaccharide transport system permease protein